MVTRRRLLLMLFLVSVLELRCAPSFLNGGYVPSSGTLDRSWGASGVSLVDFPTGDAVVLGAILQADGKVVVSGRIQESASSHRIAAIRLLADGTLDSGFASEGKLERTISGYDGVYGPLLYPDGRLLLHGFSSASAASTSHKALAIRIAATGTVDGGFASAGTLSTQVSGNAANAVAGTLDSSERVLLGGWTTFNGSAFNLWVSRYTTAGSLDSSFGTSGVFTLAPPAGGFNVISKLRTAANGTVYALTQVRNASGDYDVGLLRLLPDGAIDTAFGSAGQVVTPVGAADDLANDFVLVDDKILVVGSTQTGARKEMLLLRYRADGSLDSAFGSSGKVVLRTGIEDEELFRVAVQGDGRIVATGSRGAAAPRWLVVRFTSDGRLDTEFGETGHVEIPLPAGATEARGRGLALQPDGAIVSAGDVKRNGRYGFASVRLFP